MATVPRLDGPTVAPTARPSRMGALESYGLDQRPAQAIAAGIADIGEAVAREAERMDEIRANEEEAGLLADANKLWSDPAQGYGNLRGTKAIEGMDRFQDQLRQAVSKREGALKTPRQRALYQRSADRVMREMQSRSLAHASREQEASDKMSHDALMAADSNSLALAARGGDAKAVDELVTVMADRVATFADRQGARPEVIAGARAAVVSSARALQVEQLANAKDIEGARAAFARYGDVMGTQDRENAQNVVKEADDQVRGQQAEDRIMAQYGDDRAAAEAAARREPSDIRDDVVNRVAARLRRDAETKKQFEDDQLDGWLATVTASGRVESLSASDIAAAKKQRGAWPALLAAAKAIQSGSEPETDWGVWTNFMAMMPEDIAKMNPARDLRPYLSDGLYAQALSTIASVKGTGGRRDPEAAMVDAQDTDKIIRQSAQDAGIATLDAKGKYSSDESLALQRIMGQAYQALENARAKKKAALTPTERRATIREVFDYYALERAGSGRPAFPALTPEDVVLQRATRWEELVSGGMTAAAASAQVLRELP